MILSHFFDNDLIAKTYVRYYYKLKVIEEVQVLNLRKVQVLWTKPT